MKSALIFTVVAMAITTAAAIQCYNCVSGDISGVKDHPLYHKKCKEGKLPDKHALTCPSNPNARSADLNIRVNKDPFASGIINPEQIRYNVTCFKMQGKQGKDEANIKGCYYDATTTTPLDVCRSDTEEGVTGTLCLCKDNKCNDATAMKTSLTATFMTVAAVAIMYHL